MYLNYFLVLQTAVDGALTQTPTLVLPNTGDVIGRIFGMLAAFVFVALLAFYATRWIAVAKMGRQRTGNLRLIEQMQVGLQNSVQLLKAGERYWLIGVTKERITLLGEIPAEELALDKPEAAQLPQLPFESVLSRVVARYRPKSDDKLE